MSQDQTQPKKRSLADIIAAKKLAQQEIEAEVSQPTPSPITTAVKRSLKDMLAERTKSATDLSISSTPASPISPVTPSIPASSTSPISQEAIATIPFQQPNPSQALAIQQITQIEEQIKEDCSMPPAETFSLDIVLNKDQQLAKELAFAGKSFCLIGAAGTGKTTAQREVAAELIRQNKLGIHNFRIQGIAGARVDAPSIAFVAYTRIAAGNLKRAIHKDPDLEAVLLHNITTVHNLLEYAPETYWDYEESKEKFRFIPKRTASNPLDITHLIIEEASMLGLDLWAQLYAALRPDTQIIFIGDINQLPPVFGPSILNYALVQLPIVELTHVYRQKEGSSILDNAHKILSGKAPLIEDANFKVIRGGTIQYTQSKLALGLSSSLQKWEEVGEYDPEQDIVLSPWNKQDLGTDMLNKYISQFLGQKRNAVVHEIICGINKIYLAEGDKVLYNKQVGIVSSIRRNGEYYGKAPKTASVHLTRHGTYNGTIDDNGDDFELAGYADISLEELAAAAADEEKKRKASHIVELEMETGITATLSAVGDFAPQSFSLGYALTVHKAQGCEWRKVFLVLHRDHAISAYRELFYTAVTRAREQFVLIAKDTMIEKAIKTQRIKGNTLNEKIAFFNAGLMGQENVPCTK